MSTPKCALCGAPFTEPYQIAATGNAGGYCEVCWNCRRGDCMAVDTQATRAGIDRVESIEEAAFADAEQAALAGWDYLGPKCLSLVERVLASQGEAAEPELVKLQHELSQHLTAHHAQNS